MQLRAIIVAILVIILVTARAAEPVVATSHPVKEVNLTFPEAGVIDDVLVKEGDLIQPEQILATMDFKVLEASLRIAQIKAASRATIQSAEADLTIKKRRAEELQRLATSGSANRDEVDRAKAELESAQATLDAAKEETQIHGLQAEQIQAQIDRHMLRSSLHGVVTRIYHEPAEYVDPNQGVVMTVAKVSELYLVYYLDAGLASQLKAGDEQSVSPVGSGAWFQATVDFVSPTTDSASGTVRVKLLLPNEEGLHRAGEKYEVRLN